MRVSEILSFVFLVPLVVLGFIYPFHLTLTIANSAFAIFILLLQSGIVAGYTRMYIGPRLRSAFGLYAIGWMIIAIHEISHYTMTRATGSKVDEIVVTPFAGYVKPNLSGTPRPLVWISVVTAGLAPTFLPPFLIFLALPYVFGFSWPILSIDPYHLPSQLSPGMPFWMSGTFAYTYEANTSLLNAWMENGRFLVLNPLFWVFVYFFLIVGLSAGASLEDWSYAVLGTLRVWRYSIPTILGLMLVLTLIAVLDTNLAFAIYGFVFFQFEGVVMAVVSSAFLAIIIKKLSGEKILES
ncbi:MAG: hypothetical protein HYU39_03180 [Thaumarchaeota archaeon]|nr:hypothetical protein [Nitrososphaerota archaeon]